MPSPTVLVGEFKHETNTFSPTVADRATFQDRWELFGDDIPEYFGGTASPIGGFLDRADDLGFDLEFSVAANAMPGGHVTADAYTFYTERLVEAATDCEGLDAVYLSLHGAMVPEGRDDGEGPLLAALREAVDDTVPIVATLDPHTNLADRTASLADALFAYETYPHVDYAERGRDAATFIADRLAGRIDPVVAVERPPVLPDFPLMNTREGPMQGIARRARELESREAIRKVNLLFGFNHADTPETGMAVAVVADGDRDAAQSVARRLASYVWDRRDQLVGEYPTTEEAVEYVAEALAADADAADGPVLLIDVGDNPGGGGVEDRTELLAALLDGGVRPDEGGVALVWDPASVADCVEAGVGTEVTLELGHHLEDRRVPGDPLTVDGRIRTITDGEFTNRGPKETGVQQHLGRTVRLECDGIDVLVTENRLSPNDAEIWRHVGIPPERADLLVLKTVNHFRADYEPMANDIVLVDTPGSFAIDLSRFDYERMDGPRFPLQTEIDYPDW